MIDPTPLEALAERVEAGEYGWRINAEVLVAVGEYRWENEAEKNSHGSRWLIRVEDGRAVFDHQLPPVSTSLDAIEAARVRLLPGWRVADVKELRVKPMWHAALVRDDGGDRQSGVAPTERHARLAALLRAYAAKVRAEGERA